MKLTKFQFDDYEDLPAIQLDNGDWYFSAQETCIFAELSRKETAARWVRTNIPPKWIQELKTPGDGRPGVYLTKPGFYWAVCQGKSEAALKFRDWVFEDLLPKIDRGEAALVSSPQQAIQFATPNTSLSDQFYFLHRDSLVKTVYDFRTVHQVLNYKIPKQDDRRFYDETWWLDRLNNFYSKLCAANLIYGHDYFFDEHGNLQVFYVGLEYLLPFARPKQKTNPDAIGMKSCFLVFDKLMHLPLLSKTPNGFQPAINALPVSALMKAGLAQSWYPISSKGLKVFDRIWKDCCDGERWYESARRFAATLNTDHWTYFPTASPKKMAFDYLPSDFCELIDKDPRKYKFSQDPWHVQQHSNCKYLYRARNDFMAELDKNCKALARIEFTNRYV